MYGSNQKRRFRMNQKNIGKTRNKQTSREGVIVENNGLTTDGVIIGSDVLTPTPNPTPNSTPVIPDVDEVIIDENEEQEIIQTEIIIEEIEVIETNPVDFACNPTQGCQTLTLNDCFNNQQECKNACQRLGANAGGFVYHDNNVCGLEGCHFPRERQGECLCYVNATYNNDFDQLGDNNLTIDQPISLFRINHAQKGRKIIKKRK